MSVRRICEAFIKTSQNEEETQAFLKTLMLKALELELCLSELVKEATTVYYGDKNLGVEHKKLNAILDRAIEEHFD